MTLVKDAANMILDDTPAEDVIRFLRQRCKTLSSLNSVMSLVRTEVLKEGNRHKEYNDTEMRKHIAVPGVSQFLGSSLRDQYKIQKAHASCPTWPSDVEEALKRMRLGPAALNGFYLSRNETVELKRKQEDNQKLKNESVIVVQEAGKLIGRMQDILRSASSTNCAEHLALSLLLASGRRMVEILNGRSTFEAVEGSEYHCLFGGQVKKRGKSEKYVIPLLCKFSEFKRAFDIMRTKTQGTDVLSNADVNKLYHMKLRRQLNVKKGLPYMPNCKIHDLRAAYASAVFILCECKDTFARTCMDILGHESIHESLSYNHIRLLGLEGVEKRPLRPAVPLPDCGFDPDASSSHDIEDRGAEAGQSSDNIESEA